MAKFGVAVEHQIFNGRWREHEQRVVGSAGDAFICHVTQDTTLIYKLVNSFP